MIKYSRLNIVQLTTNSIFHCLNSFPRNIQASCWKSCGMLPLRTFLYYILRLKVARNATGYAYELFDEIELTYLMKSYYKKIKLLDFTETQQVNRLQ